MILAAHAWPTNAELVEDCARLGYLGSDWLTLDPTYGRGTWWTMWQPTRLIGHDLRSDGVDFRSMPYDPGAFDAAVFDPPYISTGGRKTSTAEDFNDRYGLHTTPKTPKTLQEDLINPGITELARVIRPRGMLLVKCMDYVSSGRLWPGTHHTLTHALSVGFDLVDRLEHIRTPGPQPPRDRQVHARRNLSTLFVLRRAAR